VKLIKIKITDPVKSGKLMPWVTMIMWSGSFLLFYLTQLQGIFHLFRYLLVF